MDGLTYLFIQEHQSSCCSPLPRDSQMRDCKKQGGLRHLKACLFHSHTRGIPVMSWGRESARDVIFEEPDPIISFHSLNMRPQASQLISLGLR